MGKAAEGSRWRVVSLCRMTGKRREDVRQLLQEYDGAQKPSFDGYTGAPHFFLVYGKEAPAGYLQCHESGAFLEVAYYVSVKFRRQGVFRALLAAFLQAKRTLDEERQEAGLAPYRVLLLSDPPDAEGSGFLRHIGAKKHHSEYLMTLAAPAGGEAVLPEGFSWSYIRGADYTDVEVTRDDCFAALAMLVLQQSRCFLHDVSVATQYRRQGLGSFVVQKAAEEAAGLGLPMYFHVHGKNRRAMGMYAKLGAAVVLEQAWYAWEPEQLFWQKQMS